MVKAKKKPTKEVKEVPEVVEEKIVEEVVVEEKVEEKVEKKTVKAKPKKISSKLAVETVVVCKEADGSGGKVVEGVVSKDKKSVTTLAGVTYAL